MILDLLMEQTGLGRGDLLRLIKYAPVRYKVYTIPKRSGGERTIAQPSRPLKALQRIIASECLSHAPVHDAATAYRSGISILDNAKAHVASDFVLKLDFVNFFNSLRVEDWDKFTRRQFPEWDRADREIVRQILFYGGGETSPRYLSVGAPSSPVVSNVLMKAIDDQIAAFCQKVGVVFTRYADDITLSSKKVENVLAAEAAVRRILGRSKSPALAINENKRGLYSRAGRRMVTGLIITPDAKVSIGRERKREISAMIDHIRKRKTLTREHIMKTKGFLAFAMACEPAYFESLCKKYGEKFLRRILAFQAEPKSSATE